MLTKKRTYVASYFIFNVVFVSMMMEVTCQTAVEGGGGGGGKHSLLLSLLQNKTVTPPRIIYWCDGFSFCNGGST